ncbi:MAG: J domain-containing protein [Bryobacteraceae bacterium]
MNYYEELGIRQDAVIEEIRQAYKVLARLLHPDGQPDERLKAMAECQMKRLHEILATLTDSQKRREYDESLCKSSKATLDFEPPPVPVPPAYWYRLMYFGLRHWFWILIGLGVVGAGLWYISQGAPETALVVADQSGAVPDGSGAGRPGVAVPRVQSSGVATKAAPPPATATAPRAATHADARQVTVADQAAAKSNPPEPSKPARAMEPPPSIPIAVAEVSKLAAQPQKLEVASSTASAHEVSFAGNWFYAPETAGKMDPNLYPATSVEFILEEENGTLVGSYRAKYRVPDQAISPEVQFRVQGKSPNGKSCKLAWASEDGAQGEAELTLRSSNQMNVTWWTTVFGRHAALSSGMAVLVRQQTP